MTLPEDRLNALALACEKASGPDRELSCKIAREIGYDGGVLGSQTSSPWAWCPDYTASIDAAMTLVPEGLGWRLNVFSKERVAHIFPDNEDYTGPCLAFSRAASPALALTAAALRALALKSGEG